MLGRVDGPLGSTIFDRSKPHINLTTSSGMTGSETGTTSMTTDPMSRGSMTTRGSLAGKVSGRIMDLEVHPDVQFEIDWDR